MCRLESLYWLSFPAEVSVSAVVVLMPLTDMPQRTTTMVPTIQPQQCAISCVCTSAGVLQQLARYLRRLDAHDVCSSTALSQTLGPLLLQPQRIPGEPQVLIDSAITVTELLIG